jgi:hypothetical protein
MLDAGFEKHKSGKMLRSEQRQITLIETDVTNTSSAFKACSNSVLTSKLWIIF